MWQVDDYLFSYIGLSVCGRPEDLVAPGDVLDHPGVWEDARDSCVALLPPPDTHTRTPPRVRRLVYSAREGRLCLDLHIGSSTTTGTLFRTNAVCLLSASRVSASTRKNKSDMW